VYQIVSAVNVDVINVINVLLELAVNVYNENLVVGYLYNHVFVQFARLNDTIKTLNSFITDKRFITFYILQIFVKIQGSQSFQSNPL
jgi:hypothetical protein